MKVEVRCRGCGRLLGVVKNGIFENKHGRQIIRAERAVVVCPKCETENRAGIANGKPAWYDSLGDEHGKKGKTGRK